MRPPYPMRSRLHHEQICPSTQQAERRHLELPRKQAEGAVLVPCDQAAVQLSQRIHSTAAGLQLPVHAIRPRRTASGRVTALPLLLPKIPEQHLQGRQIQYLSRCFHPQYYVVVCSIELLFRSLALHRAACCLCGSSAKRAALLAAIQ